MIKGELNYTFFENFFFFFFLTFTLAFALEATSICQISTFFWYVIETGFLWGKGRGGVGSNKETKNN